MKLKIIYKNFNKVQIQEFTRKLVKITSNIKIYDLNYRGRVDIVMIFANSIYSLKYCINRTSINEKIVIVTSNINTNFILNCMSFSSCICYIKGNIDLIVKKINKLV